MKQFDFVKLTTINKNLEKFNLYPNTMGIVINTVDNFATVMFFNEHNQGDYACIKVDIKHLETSPEKPSSEIVDYFKNNILNFDLKEKGFDKKIFNMFDNVELMVENDKYAKYGIHKGFKGVIMEDFAVKNYVLVDFGQLDENGHYFGDCISVNLKDLKILK